MTDELGIQPKQKQGNYAVPGMLGGAVIGAAGGAYAAHKGYGFNITKPNLDEVFAQSPDTFKRQIEKGGENKGAWETAQGWIERINNEYDQKVADITKENTVPNDPELAKKVATAQTEYDAALSAEKAKLARANGAGSTISNFPTAEEVKNIGEKVKLEDVKAYENKLKAYTDALEKATNSADLTALETFEANVKTHIYDIKNASMTRKKPFGKSPLNKAIENLEREIETLMPDITNPKRIEHELKAAGKDYKVGSKNYRKFVDQLNATVREQRNALKEQILGERISVDIVDPKTKKVTGKRATYRNVENFVNNETGASNRIAKFKKKLPKGISYDKIDSVKVYTDELAKVNKDKTITIAQRDAKIKQLNKMIELAKEKQNIIDSNKSRIERFFSRIDYANKLKEKVQKSIMNDSSVQSAIQKLRNFIEKNEAINAITEKAETTAMTEEEIAAKAAEALKDKKAALDDLIKAAEDKGGELTAKGKKLIEDLGSKEAYQKDLKEKAAKELEPLLSKFKLPSKTWTGVAAAVVLGLAGLGIGAAVKND